MRRTVPFVLVGALALPLISACDSIIDQRGFAATPGSVEKLDVGSQSREDVVRLIGSPSTVGTFNPNVWYYISQKQETWAFLKPTMLEQIMGNVGRFSGPRQQDNPGAPTGGGSGPI